MMAKDLWVKNEIYNVLPHQGLTHFIAVSVNANEQVCMEKHYSEAFPSQIQCYMSTSHPMYDSEYGTVKKKYYVAYVPAYQG